MSINEAREISARAWCDPRVSNREMDSELAEVFAELLKKMYFDGRMKQHLLAKDSIKRMELDPRESEQNKNMFWSAKMCALDCLNDVIPKESE